VIFFLHTGLVQTEMGHVLEAIERIIVALIFVFVFLFISFLFLDLMSFYPVNERTNEYTTCCSKGCV